MAVAGAVVEAMMAVAVGLLGLSGLRLWACGAVAEDLDVSVPRAVWL